MTSLPSTAPSTPPDTGASRWDLILGEGAASQVPLAQTAMTRQLMVAALAQGDAQEDYATIIKVAERSAGLGTSAEDALSSRT